MIKLNRTSYIELLFLKDIQKNVSNVKYSKVCYRIWNVFKINLNIK